MCGKVYKKKKRKTNRDGWRKCKRVDQLFLIYFTAARQIIARHVKVCQTKIIIINKAMKFYMVIHGK